MWRVESGVVSMFPLSFLLLIKYVIPNAVRNLLKILCHFVPQNDGVMRKGSEILCQHLLPTD